MPADAISLLVGDCLQCLRSTLDHLAFELASAFTKPLPDDVAKDSEFPIFGNGAGEGTAKFSQLRSKGAHKGDPAPGSGLAKTRGMDAAAQAVIEGLQPYHRGQAFEQDPLWQLHELNRLDKHRILHVVGAAFEGVVLNIQRMENVIPTFNTPGMIRSFAGPIKGRTQVARWTRSLIKPQVPGKKVRVNFSPELRVTFDAATPVAGGIPVLDVLTAVKDHIVSAVIPPLQPFLK